MGYKRPEKLLLRRNNKMKVVEVDEALISFSNELFKNKVDLKLIMSLLDNRGIDKTQILYSEEITDEAKIELLQAIQNIDQDI